MSRRLERDSRGDPERRDTLDLERMDPDPMVEFARWFSAGKKLDLDNPDAMVLSTVGPDGAPSSRMVLLRRLEPDGFGFYTSYTSRKGRDLDARPRAALLFYWDALGRQVRITGSVERASREESERYFRTRPRASQISAHASPQSEEIPDRSVLKRRVEELEARFEERDVPCPEHWGGYFLRPERIEFWQNRPNRLHDRVEYRRLAVPPGGSSSEDDAWREHAASGSAGPDASRDAGSVESTGQGFRSDESRRSGAASGPARWIRSRLAP